MNKLSKDEYFKHAKFIWKNFVPKSGQSLVEQGELLRAIEKLRDEAQRNGNGNFNSKCHGILISFLREKLGDNLIFDPLQLNQINIDLNRLELEDQPYLDDDIYDRISNRIVDLYLINIEPIPHLTNTELNC